MEIQKIKQANLADKLDPQNGQIRLQNDAMFKSVVVALVEGQPETEVIRQLLDTVKQQQTMLVNILKQIKGL